MLDQLAQNLHRRLNSCQLQVLIGLVRTGNIAGPKNQGFTAKLLKIRCFRAKGYSIGGLTGQALRANVAASFTCSSLGCTPV